MTGVNVGDLRAIPALRAAGAAGRGAGKHEGRLRLLEHGAEIGWLEGVNVPRFELERRELQAEWCDGGVPDPGLWMTKGEFAAVFQWRPERGEYACDAVLLFHAGVLLLLLELGVADFELKRPVVSFCNGVRRPLPMPLPALLHAFEADYLDAARQPAGDDEKHLVVTAMHALAAACDKPLVIW